MKSLYFYATYADMTVGEKYFGRHRRKNEGLYRKIEGGRLAVLEPAICWRLTGGGTGQTTQARHDEALMIRAEADGRTDESRLRLYHETAEEWKNEAGEDEGNRTGRSG